MDNYYSPAFKKKNIDYISKNPKEIIGSSFEINYAETQRGDAKHTLADIGLAKDLMDYEPSVGIEKGLKRFVEWYRGVWRIKWV